jgi:hypothetical protein
MATIAHSPAFPGARKTLEAIAMLCGAVLFVSLLIATYGLDLSPVFF